LSDFIELLEVTPGLVASRAADIDFQPDARHG
jgi:hypothetical protein